MKTKSARSSASNVPAGPKQSLPYIAKETSMRLDKLLANLGICGRRTATRIQVASMEVLPSDVMINGRPLEYAHPLHIVLHKPVEYVCSRVKDVPQTKLIYDLFPPSFIKRHPPLSIAGRLDKYASGIVLLSQNGSFINRIISPKHHLERVYEIKAKKPFSGTEPRHFASGEILLQGEKKPLKPAKFEILDPEQHTARLTLYEGRYHQIRRMMGTISNSTVSIHRVRIGPFSLEGLEVGQWRLWTEEEVKELLKVPFDPATKGSDVEME